MAPPGSLDARYEQLAGGREAEFYTVRRRLGFTIDEWRELPWWQRRVYLTGLRDEADAAERAREGQTSAAGDAARQGGIAGLDALYHGTIDEARSSVRHM